MRLRLLRLFLGRARELEDAETEAQNESDLAVAEIALDRASAILEIELNTADVLDFKAVGLAGADIAALTILTAVHGDVPFWWGPAALMFVSALFFLRVMRARDWEFGPDFQEFRENQFGKSRLEITEAMLSEVLHALDTNEPFVKEKGRNFKRGYRILVVAIVVLVAAAINKAVS